MPPRFDTDKFNNLKQRTIQGGIVVSYIPAITAKYAEAGEFVINEENFNPGRKSHDKKNVFKPKFGAKDAIANG